MQKMALKVSGGKIEIPAYYEKMKKVPPELKGKTVYGVRTENASCLVITHHSNPDGMIYDRDMLIQAMHDEILGNNQGLVEAGSGELDGRPYLYSIIKTLLEDNGMPMGVQYNLSMDIAEKKGSIHIQGFFTEEGVTGMRDSMVFAMRSSELGGMEAAQEGWACDPYNPLRKVGALMNISEREEYDNMFPEHPLSMARSLLHCILGQDDESAPEAIRLDDAGGEEGNPIFGKVGGLFGKAAEAAGGIADKAGIAAGAIADAAGDAAGSVAELAGGAAGAAGEAAGAAKGAAEGAIMAVGDKVEDIKAAKDEPDEYDLAVIAYNMAYTDLSDGGLDLLKQRERAVDLIGHVEELVNSIANRPKSFDRDLGEVATHKQDFTEAERFAREELAAARKSAASASAGVAAGMAVASLAPSAALWVATTFGTASTGAAISTLSGAAASQAALAWLGGGAITAGGGGVAAGNALLALAGPIGWGIAGATLLASIALFTKKKFELREEKQKELTALKENTEKVAELAAKVGALLSKTSELRENLAISYGKCLATYGKDYSKLDADDQDRLSALVNNTLGLSRLLNEVVVQEALPEGQGEE